MPALPGTFAYIAAGYLTRGSTRNPDHFRQHVTFAPTVSDTQRILLWEAETSGGLLAAVPAAGVAAFRGECEAAGQDCWEIGEVVAGVVGIEVV